MGGKHTHTHIHTHTHTAQIVFLCYWNIPRPPEGDLFDLRKKNASGRRCVSATGSEDDADILKQACFSV